MARNLGDSLSLMLPSDHEQLTYARCCAKCLISEGPDLKLLSCAACKTSRYCSRECQKADWKSHKIICQNQQLRKAVVKVAEIVGNVSIEGIDTRLKKWLHHYRTILFTTGLHALDLITNPDNLLTDAFLIELKENFISRDPSIPTRHSFTVIKMERRNMSTLELLQQPHMKNVLSEFIETTRKLRLEGGFGIFLIVAWIPEYQVANLSPLGSAYMLGNVPPCPDWEARFRRHVGEGTVF